MKPRFLNRTSTSARCLYILLFFIGIIAAVDSLGTSVGPTDWAKLNLPENHLPYFFRNSPDVKEECLQDDSCPYKEAALASAHKCWGYEENCPMKQRMVNPSCPQSSNWVPTKEAQLDSFWSYGDFGQVAKRKLSLRTYCTPMEPGDSLLECSDHVQYCRGENIWMDLSHWDFDKRGRTSRPATDRFVENIFEGGHIGGRCSYDQEAFKKQGDHKSPLQSWYGELEDFAEQPMRINEGEGCDITFEEPVYLMKLDAGINMYHHFCDFINLYVSQHLTNRFTTNMTIIMWDTSNMGYYDPFSVTFDAFSDSEVVRLESLRNNKVCFKDVVFSLLPRQRLGLYYNMPLIDGCYNTALFPAFSEHLLHRLDIHQNGPMARRIRVTLLSRQTKFRNIINEEELVDAMKEVGGYEVSRVVYNRDIPFIDQLKKTHNSDVFICMHGAGLTHLLFQPNWGSVIELHNCGDPGCYSDLARLKGVKYFTWTNEEKVTQKDEGQHPTLGAHQKFTDYSFDKEEFLRLVAEAAEHVRSHRAFKDAQAALHPLSSLADKDEL